MSIPFALGFEKKSSPHCAQTRNGAASPNTKAPLPPLLSDFQFALNVLAVALQFRVQRKDFGFRQCQIFDD